LLRSEVYVTFAGAGGFLTRAEWPNVSNLECAMKDFFISYNKADRRWAEWIAWQLEEASYSTVIQAWDFRPGGNFVLDMQQATAQAKRTIAVLSPDYLTALYTQPEWAAAFAQDPTGEKHLLVPVRVRECEIKGLLPQIVYVDLVKLDEAAARHALLEGVKRGRVKPQQQPDFPGASPRTIVNKPQFPGALPPIWNIKHHRNPNFTGREEELKALRASLLAGETAALVQAITGLGGIGKTQLALEYAYRHGGDYDAVWWVRSEDPLTLAGDYASLAARLDLPEKEEQQVIVDAVKEWLRLNPGWLLIFDNAEDVKLTRGYIPPGNTGHVVITSRNPQWKGAAKPLPVKTLPVAEAIELLGKRTGQQDDATTKRLAEALGCLPLALEQAGAYIEACGCTLAHYLDLFEKRQYDLMQEGEPSTEYPTTVATTWNLSFQSVEAENPAAAELLRLCAFFAPDAIPLKMLIDGADELPESLAATVCDTFLLDKAVMALRKYSLVEVENEKLTIHRLVQAVVRHALNKDAFKQWTGIAAHIVNASFSNESLDARTWSICAPLLPHASTALSHTETIQFVSPETTRLLTNAGLYLQARAEYTQAKKMLERALAIDKVALGPNHPDVAIDLNNLGSVLKDQGDLAGAKTIFERALAIDEAAFGLDHPDVAIDLNNLGMVLKDQGDLAGAKALFERAINIGEAALGLDHPQVATFANNLGLVLQAQGDLTNAKILLERALAIDEAALGPNHPKVAIRLNNLGMVLQAQGDLAGAKALFERALAIDEAALGLDHPQVASFANNLGMVLQAQGDLAGAKALFERALAIDEAALGPNHPSVAIRLNNLGSVLKAQDDLAGAKALFERALRIFREFLGDNHPNTRTVKNNLQLLEEELKNAKP
jgi:tetratricopeptide (TPR) repeat protein